MRKSWLIGASFVISFTGALAWGMSYPPSAVYRGSSFNEVWQVVTASPEISLKAAGNRSDAQDDIKAYGTPENPKLPQFSVKLGSVLSGAIRTVQDRVDYYDYFQKPVHPNGTCFSGVWEITEDSPYSGLFKKGSSALMIGRVSSADPQTTYGKERAFGIAGKLFPTTNPEEVVKTANFFTVDDLNGTMAAHMLDVATINEPHVNFFSLKGAALKILSGIFSLADRNPNIRPLYPIARAGVKEGQVESSPIWMRLRVAPGVKSASANDADFRDELSAKNYPNGLLFTIEVSDTTNDGLNDAGWQRIGRIRTSPMLTSFGCDRRLHFSHPTMDEPKATN